MVRVSPTLETVLPQGFLLCVCFIVSCVGSGLVFWRSKEISSTWRGLVARRGSLGSWAYVSKTCGQACTRDR